ncbi:MAG: hypothetical protein IJU03_09665 [Thermoguttaceae bacterium]|nr:hypothetical protein [Thermoguttaceae bacterium]
MTSTRNDHAIAPSEFARIAVNLLTYARERNFEGVDPYDALNSPFANLLTLGTKPGRIILTQLLRRSPINFRPILRVKPAANPKALGLFLEGVVKLARLQRERKLNVDLDLPEIARALVARLLELRSPNASGAAWGYNFPWQNRFQLLPPWTPTIVNVAFIAHALLDYFDAFQDSDALDLARSSAEFILNDLNRLDVADSEFCFSYTPLDENYVHNANLLGASLLLRLAVQYDRPELYATALAAYRYTLNRQREDGAWFYAERREQHWIDSFHTGFNLEAIRRALELGALEEYRDAYHNGVRFYAYRFFEENGRPNYYADRPYLVDVHAPMEALCFFAREKDYEALTLRVANWTLENMLNRAQDGFYFRKSNFLTIKTRYMRWSQAWGFRAFAELASQALIKENEN